MLKQHESMYNDQERLFMVRSISYVFDAALSCGVGRFDFFDDIRQIQPDIYFCNEDASELQTRVGFCKDHNIEIVIAKRSPAIGLAERSSTSMKERLKEIIQAEENIKNINNMSTSSMKQKLRETIQKQRMLKLEDADASDSNILTDRSNSSGKVFASSPMMSSSVSPMITSRTMDTDSNTNNAVTKNLNNISEFNSIFRKFSVLVFMFYYYYYYYLFDIFI